MARFDFEETFGDDYLHFYADTLSDAQSDADVEVIVSTLGLTGDETVLDAPCGHGRIGNRLAARGHEVVGVDASEVFLARAREWDGRVEFLKGDLRALPVDGPFDVALSWFTSFGYFDDDDNQQVLSEYRRVLRRGGRLLMELHNHDEIVRRFTPAPFGATTRVGDDVMIDTSEFDTVTGRMETDRFLIRDGRLRESHHSVRMPTIPELRAWLAEAGFSDATFTARDGNEPSIHRPRLLVIATA
ncbi:MAG TPA: methyltransferase domain-containing protein [Acidimicrobiales bacterium]|nr:methyltransferase domain-containing protein [Acidimicrobiales bacterium]